MKDTSANISYQEIISDDSEARGSLEDAKIAFTRGFTRSMSWKPYILHTVALGATTAILTVNCLRTYGWDEGLLPSEHSLWLNSLQFVAKLHEIIIVASITLMIQQDVIRRLVGPEGLPFGLLGGGNQAGSLSYFLDPSLWGARKTAPRFAVGIALAAVYCNVVGPSSAIAIIPRLDWWDVTKPYDTVVPRLVITQDVDSPVDLYPSKLEAPNMTALAGCDSTGYSEKCPGAGFDTLKQWVASWYNSGVSSGLFMTEAVSQARRKTDLDVSQVYNIIETQYPDFLDGNVTTASTIPHSLVQMLGLYSDFAQNTQLGLINKIKRPKFATRTPMTVKLPVVQAQCYWYNYTAARRGETGVYFPMELIDDAIPPNLNTTSYSWAVDPRYWNFTRPLNTTNFTWLDVSSYPNSSSWGASLGALFTLPVLYDQQESELVPCLISANWAAADLEFDPRADNLVVSNLTNADLLLDRTHAAVSSTAPKTPLTPIAISPQWARLLDISGIPMPASGSQNSAPGNTTMVQALIRNFIYEGEWDQASLSGIARGDKFTTLQPYWGHQAVAPILAAVIVEGLSRHDYNQSIPAVIFDDGQTNITTEVLTVQRSYDGGGLRSLNSSLIAPTAFRQELNQSSVAVDLAVFRYGYGYGTVSQPATVILGLVMLALHALAVLIYLVCKIYHRRKGRAMTEKAWGSIGELLALAMVSHSARGELGNVGAGVKAPAVWQKMVRIRERGANELQLIVGGCDEEARMPQPNKKYC